MADSDERRSRELILARRALFISSALGLVGCGPAVPATSAPGPGAVVASPPEAVEPTDAEPADGKLPPRRASVDAPPELPPLSVPGWVTETARERFEGFNTSILRAHKLVDQMENAVPANCDAPASGECAAALEAFAAAEHELNGVLRFMGPMCPGSSDSAKAFAEHAALHRAHLDTRIGSARARLDAVLKPHGSHGAATLESARQNAERASPQPCLSFGCRDW